MRILPNTATVRVRFLWTLAALLLPVVAVAQPLPSGEGGPEGAAPAGAAVDERLQLAVSNPDYPVTPGDVYQLTFLQGVETITTPVMVQSDYDLYLGVFGEVDARDKQFTELKSEIEQIVANAYPRGFPSLSITSVGVFQVTLSGSIPQSRRVSAWGLSHLSDLLDGTIGSATSLREVRVRSADGTAQTYDVFRAMYLGETAEDPLLRPGDTVTFRRQDLTVQVSGEVYAPGSYELMSNEGLPELERFFQGFTPSADTRRLVVERQTDSGVTQLTVGSPSDAEEFSFRNGDRLIVPPRVVPQPVVYVEGAIDIEFSVEPHEDADSALPVYNRVTQPLTAGDTLYNLLIDMQDRISPFADIERGYVIRQGAAEATRIDMRQVLYRQSEYADYELRPFDRIVIPIDQPFVIVSGDVTSPGRYPYNPFEDFAYYLNLAGTGSDAFDDLRGVVRVLDDNGEELPRDTRIQPGFTVHVPPREDRFVIVSGDVPDPGAYVYEPSRDFSYYVRLAGVGANAFASVRNSVEIYDGEGEELPFGSGILPDYTVYVPSTEEELTPDGAFVLVTGAVNAPGPYEIFGERRANYYILQAGGVDTEVSADGSYTVRSADGTPRSDDAIIGPGDTVEVARNGFVYNFNRYFPIVTGGLTFITTIITIVNAVNQAGN